ncbi:hypothetical protein GRJ2_003454400 [Grus japonensis]|uniref:RING-type E3 ubiquitin transferase n=1 Tax=Grus japonensis TaxID=30415 RepID=A0ABC9YL65_GRUJA
MEDPMLEQVEPPEGGCGLVGSPCWSKFQAGPVDPCIGEPTPGQDRGDEFTYTGSGGRDLSGNKRIGEHSFDQTLTHMNRALALNCDAPLDDKNGAESKNWRAGKPVRVVRSSKGRRISKYAPEEGNRYDGIYKAKKEAYQLWKGSQIVIEDYKNLARACRDAVRKAKAQLELKLARGVKNNKKGFFSLTRSLQGQVAELKEQLKAEKDQVKHLQTALKEQLLADTTREEIPPRSEIGYPFNDLQAAKEKVEKLEPLSLRPLVKTEYIYDDEQDQSRQVTTKEVPYTAVELMKLKKEFGQTPKESETEYVWRVSLSGGNRILLSEREAEGYWGPGVFLTTGNHRAPWSLTQRAAYWAGGLNPLERGDPLAITGTVDQLVESVQKAACLQVMYDRKLEPRQESPMMMPVDPE